MLNKLYLCITTLLIALSIVLYVGIKHYIHNKIDSGIQQGMNEFILTSQNKAIEKIALDTQNYLKQSSKRQEALIRKYNAIPSITLPLLEVTPSSNQTNRANTTSKPNTSQTSSSQLNNSNQLNPSSSNSKSLNKDKDRNRKEKENEHEELNLDDFEFPSFKSVLFPNLPTKQNNYETQIKEIQNALDIFFNTPHAF